MTILNHDTEILAECRQISRKCPTGYLVVHDQETNRVYYRDVHSPKEISTNFTEAHIRAAKDLSPQDPDRLDWDRGNSESAGIRFDVYTARGK